MLAVSKISLKVIFINAFLSSLSCADCLWNELLHKGRERLIIAPVKQLIML